MGSVSRQLIGFEEKRQYFDFILWQAINALENHD